jgi:hypothetical protein
VWHCSSSSEVGEALRLASARRIAIDGTDGSGKSTLARELGWLLGTHVFHLDDFVAKNLGAYVAHIDQVRLASAIATSEFFVIEGVCILQALELASVRPDALVYVKRMSHGYWCDEDELEPKLPIEEHLAQIRATMLPFSDALGESGELGLAEEVIRYHAAYRPHLKATIAYLRADA